MFNFEGHLTIGSETLPEGVIMSPISKQAKHITLPPNAMLSGIRFHPAIGYGVLGQHYEKPTMLDPEEDGYGLYQLYARLKKAADNDRHVRTNSSDNAHMDILFEWAEQNLDFINIIPDSLEQALDQISNHENIGQLKENIPLSQRQLERLFKRWLGMTPKHYQRILRIKKAIYFLRNNPLANLADVAFNFGFSDQAHMTREFRAIACITPAQI